MRSRSLVINDLLQSLRSSQTAEYSQTALNAPGDPTAAKRLSPSRLFVCNSIRILLSAQSSEDGDGGIGKDRIARQTANLRVTFDMALSNKRKYPVAEFKAFVQSARRYIEITAGDLMIHKSVVRAVNGLREFLEVERKRIPGDILFEADRLECQLFAGYDPSFDGNEPPGL
jgi:hypothetical protein